jgi:hypothetical protein
MKEISHEGKVNFTGNGPWSIVALPLLNLVLPLSYNGVYLRKTTRAKADLCIDCNETQICGR